MGGNSTMTSHQVHSIVFSNKQDGKISGPHTRYGIVIEKALVNDVTYVPDLPGCVDTATTLDETETSHGLPHRKPSSR
jgi:hypothetical protein